MLSSQEEFCTSLVPRVSALAAEGWQRVNPCRFKNFEDARQSFMSSVRTLGSCRQRQSWLAVFDSISLVRYQYLDQFQTFKPGKLYGSLDFHSGSIASRRMILVRGLSRRCKKFVGAEALDSRDELERLRNKVVTHGPYSQPFPNVEKIKSVPEFPLPTSPRCVFFQSLRDACQRRMEALCENGQEWVKK